MLVDMKKQMVLNPRDFPLDLRIPNTIKQINMFPQCWIPQNLSSSLSIAIWIIWVSSARLKAIRWPSHINPQALWSHFLSQKSPETTPSAIHCRSRLALPAPGLAPVPVPVPGGAWPAAWVGHSSRRWRPDGTRDTWV